jgi:hypothetical protein
MTTFDDREKAYEKKFALDADLKFKAEQRRNKALAEWAGAKMGLAGSALEDYVKAVRKSDLAAKSVKVDDADIRKVMGEALAKAVMDIESGK